MAIEGLGIELSKNIDLVKPTVDAVTHWDIY